jgi:hypothetical protein
MLAGGERVVNNTMVAGTTGGRSESAAGFARLLACIEGSPAGREAAVEPRLAALAAVRDGVITGEGPTTAGRIHFSRCIDAADTALVRRILLAGGNAPITRAEADALFDIHEAAVERVDGGAFDDLFTKAITHHVLAAAGERVPARALALDMALADWARPGKVAVDGEIAAWIKARLNRKRRHHGSIVMLAACIGTAASWGASIAAAIDLAA